VLKQDDCGLAAEPGGPERSDPRVHVGVRAGAPGQVRAGRGGVHRGQVEERECRGGGRRQGESGRSLEPRRRWRGDRGWQRGRKRRGDGRGPLRRAGVRLRPFLGEQVVARRGVSECVGGGVVEAVVLQRGTRPGQQQPAGHTHTAWFLLG